MSWFYLGVYLVALAVFGYTLLDWLEARRDRKRDEEQGESRFLEVRDR